jgi:FkbM family methyltransferase
VWEDSKKVPSVIKQDGDVWKLMEFKYRDYRILYPAIFYLALREVFIYDVYQSDLLEEDDVVLDLGAGIGDFSVLASKRMGRKGQVIALEPNRQDYEILKKNIDRNNCANVIALNIGAGKKQEEKEMTFWGRTFNCRLDTMTNILNDLGIKNKINFIKMDIEGYETEIIKDNVELMSQTNVISLESHNTKEEIDGVLLPLGFRFQPVSANYMIKKILKNTIFHPGHFMKAATNTISTHPSIIYDLIKGGYDPNNNEKNVVSGSYIKDR